MGGKEEEEEGGGIITTSVTYNYGLIISEVGGEGGMDS